MDSLAWHARQSDGVREDGPSEIVSACIVEAAVQGLPSLDLPSDFMERAHYERILTRLNWKASPGHPLMHDYSTNRDLFKVNDRGEPDPLRVEMVWQMVLARLEARDSDLIRLFVKAEPHKRKKIELKRWRLISSVSILDQIIDQMLFGEMNDSWVASWFTSPMKVGWVPFKGGWKLFPKGRSLCVDKSSWDWTVRMWIVQLELRVRAACVRESPNKEKWLDLAAWRYKRLYVDNVFVTSGGVKLKQLKPGIQKSGCVNTLMTNTMMQLILHLRVCFEGNHSVGRFWCLGDDTLQDLPERFKDYLDALKTFCIVKQATLASEFAGFSFEENRVEPVYRGKHAYNMLHMDSIYEEEFRRAYQLLYYRSKHKARIEEVVGKAPASFKALWDGW